MPATVYFERSTAQTISITEWSLVTNSSSLTPITDAGLMTLIMDLSAITAADAFLLRVYETAASGGTMRLIADQPFSGQQAWPIYMSLAFPMRYGWQMTLQRIAGSDRNFTWRIERVT